MTAMEMIILVYQLSANDDVDKLIISLIDKKKAEIENYYDTDGSELKRDLMKRFVLKLRTVFENWSRGTIAKRVDNSLCMWSYPILVLWDERGMVTRTPVLKRRTLYNYIDRDGNLIRIKGR